MTARTHPLSRCLARLATSAVVVVSIIASTAVGTTPTGATTRCTVPVAVAHRGGTEVHLENTIGAFESAGAAGIEDWELDVHFDALGTPVVLHDDTVDRVSPSAGRIRDLDATSRRIPTDDGQYIPTLREVLDRARHQHAYVLVELKTTPTNAQWSTVTAVIDGTVGRDRVTVMSFDASTVLAARSRISGAVTALVHSTGYLTPDQVLSLGTAYVEINDAYSPARARMWRAAGIRLYAWTVDEPAGWQHMADVSVDAVITDRPLAYQAWAAARCTASPTPTTATRDHRDPTTRGLR